MSQPVSKRTHRRRGRSSKSAGVTAPVGSGGESGGEYDFEMVDSLDEGGSQEPSSPLSPCEHATRVVSAKEEDPVVLGSEMTMLSEWAALQKTVMLKLESLDAEHQRVSQMASEVSGLRQSLLEERSHLEEARSKHEMAVEDLKRERESVMQVKREVEKEREAMSEEMTKIRNERKTLRRDCKRASELSDSLSAKVAELSALVDSGSGEVSSLKELAKSVVSGATAKVRVHLHSMKEEQRRMQEAMLEEYTRMRRVGMYCCKQCSEPIARESDVESKCYQVGQGAFTEAKRGYLFTGAFGLSQGPSKLEKFTTGEYRISWVKCDGCQSSMGWKYLSADTKSNSIKVGKYCLSRASLTSPDDRHAEEVRSLAKAPRLCDVTAATLVSTASEDPGTSESELDESAARMSKERKVSLSASSLSEERGLEMASLMADGDVMSAEM